MIAERNVLQPKLNHAILTVMNPFRFSTKLVTFHKNKSLRSFLFILTVSFFRQPPRI